MSAKISSSIRSTRIISHTPAYSRPHCKSSNNDRFSQPQVAASVSNKTHGWLRQVSSGRGRPSSNGGAAADGFREIQYEGHVVHALLV
jgi:hypothetical protein